MEEKRYLIVDKGNETFELFYGSSLLTTFTRKNFREKMEAYADGFGYSRNWVGSIVKIFNKQHPLPVKVNKRNDLDRLVNQIGADGLADYLRSKGFRVVKKLTVNDLEIIKYLEKSGYEVQGLLNDDVYYETNEYNLKNN